MRRNFSIVDRAKENINFPHLKYRVLGQRILIDDCH